MRRPLAILTPVFVLILLCCSPVLWAQNMVITGRVTEAATGDPIPYANVYVAGKFVGTITDLDGNYTLEVNRRADSLIASTLGFLPQAKRLGTANNQVVNFELQVDAKTLDVVTIVPGENPADVLLRQVIVNKPQLNINNFKTVSYEAYTKYEIDLLDFTTENIDDSRLLARFPHLKDYVDTTSETGTSILPIFLIENLSDNYQQTGPDKMQEYVKAVKMSGVEKQDFITTLLGNVNQNLNIFENLMAVMGKNFVSPVADYALSVYKYNLHLYDTLYINGEPHLQMDFKPKRKGENTFEGTMLINLNSFAVRSIDMSLSKDAGSIELIEDLSFLMTFRPMPLANDTGTVVYWVPDKEHLKIKFNYYVGGDTRILGRKTKSYKNIVVNQPLPDNAFNAFENTIIEDDAYTHTDSFWTEMRHDTLLDSESGIYEMVDSLKRTKKFKVLVYTAQTLSSGYAPIKRVIGIGHVASFLSMNDVEGVRLRLGFRTMPKFSERVYLEGYGAYGFRDKRFKYGGTVQFIISKRPWHKLSLYARTDIDLKSRHAEEMDQDNIFSFASKRFVDQRLYNIDEYRIVYDTELHRDLVAYFSVSHRRFFPYFDFGYMSKEGVLRNNIIASEVGVTLRWQYKSKPLPGVFNREAKANTLFAQFRKTNDYPVFRFVYNVGIPNIIQSDFLYHDLAINMQGDYQFTAKMSWYYNFWVGKIFGTVPYLLLKNPEGNYTYVHNKYFFNNMNLLEFTADEYVSLNWQWFFGGMLFDRIPGIKKLGLREVVTANVFWGDMSRDNQDFNALNPIDIAYPVPYVEVGVGIQNIFKFIRIDYIQRITYLDNPHIAKWAIYGSLFIKV